MHPLRSRERRPLERSAHLASWVGAVAESYGDRVGHKWHQTLGFGGGNLEAETPIEHEHDTVLSGKLRMQIRDAPAFDDDIVVLEGARELDPADRVLKLDVAVHAPVIRPSDCDSSIATRGEMAGSDAPSRISRHMAARRL